MRRLRCVGGYLPRGRHTRLALEPEIPADLPAFRRRRDRLLERTLKAQHDEKTEKGMQIMTMTTTTTATTSFGRLRGTVDDGVVAFRGIPYAQPPIGPLRFAPPARLEGWSGTRSADRFGPAAMQTTGAATG